VKRPDRRTAQLLQDAIAAHRAGRLDAARANYERVLASDPRDPNALHFYGVLQHNQKRSAEGIESIRRSLALAPANAHAWLNLGNILLEHERSDEAKEAYARAAALAPEMADAWFNLGLSLRKLDDAAAAVRALDRAVTLRPDHAPSAYQRGIARRDAGDLAAAEADFRRAIDLKSDYTEAFESLGMLLYRQDRIAEAALVYRTWARVDPTSSTAAHLAAATSGEAVPARSSDAYVVETFDRFAATFDQNLANLGYRAPQLVVAALVSITGGRALDGLLDAGCGTGLCGPLLRPLARRLVGVDLSPAMVEGARAKGHYDELHVAELGAFMAESTTRYDAIVSADTFVYIGALEPAFSAAARCLNPAGALILTLEEMRAGISQDYRLEPHGRYSHSLEYVRRALEDAGLRLVRSDSEVLRRERGEDVRGLVLIAQAPVNCA
jgi:predicted TPR repeat methyltransferase